MYEMIKMHEFTSSDHLHSDSEQVRGQIPRRLEVGVEKTWVGNLLGIILGLYKKLARFLVSHF